MPESPCIDQTEDDIALYYRHAPIGAPAVFREVSGGTVWYRVGEIDGRKKGRVYLRKTSEVAFYIGTGKHCFHPTGQKRLVAPTRAVLDHAAANPHGVFGLSTFRRGATSIDLPPPRGDREAVILALRAAGASEPDLE